MSELDHRRPAAQLLHTYIGLVSSVQLRCWLRSLLRTCWQRSSGFCSFLCSFRCSCSTPSSPIRCWNKWNIWSHAVNAPPVCAHSCRHAAGSLVGRLHIDKHLNVCLHEAASVTVWLDASVLGHFALCSKSLSRAALWHYWIYRLFFLHQSDKVP